MGASLGRGSHRPAVFPARRGDSRISRKQHVFDPSCFRPGRSVVGFRLLHVSILPTARRKARGNSGMPRCVYSLVGLVPRVDQRAKTSRHPFLKHIQRRSPLARHIGPTMPIPRTGPRWTFRAGSGQTRIHYFLPPDVYISAEWAIEFRSPPCTTSCVHLDHFINHERTQDYRLLRPW